MSKSRKCGIARCPNMLSEHSRLDECPRCRASFYYWRKRPVHLRVRRRQNLGIYSDRMDVVIGKTVVLMTSKRKAR